MVNNIPLRVERLQLAKAIIRRELELGGAPNFSNAEITKAAWVYLAITRHNTTRLRSKLKKLNLQ